MRRIKVVLLFLLGCPGVLGAVTPEWVRSAAQQSARSYGEEVNMVALLEDKNVSVRDNGDIVTRMRYVFKLIRPQGKKMLSYFPVPFADDTRLNYLKAWTIAASGQEYEAKDSDFIEVSGMTFEVYSDAKFKVVKLPGIETGTVVGIEYEQRQRPYTFEEEWFFQKPYPVERSHFQLHLPAHWEFRTFWVNYQEQSSRNENGDYVWDLAGLSEIEEEADMPNWRALAGRMIVTLVSEKTKGRTYANWDDLGSWFTQLTVGVRDSTPALQQKVNELAPASQPLIERIKALGRFAQKDIRYAAIEIGIGGYQPHHASDIFANRYGDCKDKATLLSTMLGQIGVKSYYMLVDTHRGIFTEKSPPEIGFNHAILAIQLPDASYSKPLAAVYEHPRLGHLLIFDPTNPMVPFGQVPYYEQDNYGLLITEKGGELIHIPMSGPEFNRITRTAKFSLLPDGALKGEVEEVRSGAPAFMGRAAYMRQTEAERRKMIESFLARTIGNFQLESVEAENLDNIETDLIVHYKFTAEHYGKNAGALLLVRPRVFGEKTFEIGKKPRRYPYEFRTPTLQTDIFEINLPEGYQIDEVPNPVTAIFPLGEYNSKIENSGHQLKYSREYKITGTQLSADKTTELKKFLAAINEDERSMAVLKKSN